MWRFLREHIFSLKIRLAQDVNLLREKKEKYNYNYIKILLTRFLLKVKMYKL